MNLAAREHLNLLRERVFQCDSLWPQFRLLVEDLEHLSCNLSPGSVVVSLERSLLYGGYSIIAPLFQDCTFISIDCSPASADNRGAYNSSMLADSRFIPIPITRRASIEANGLADLGADLVLVPNLVHHISNQQLLFKEISRILKPGGVVYIFEPLVREIHQAPDDFLRYTPHGLEQALRSAGLVPEDIKTEGGPFQVISYCWTQALQYLPETLRDYYSEWFFDHHFKELLALDANYKFNLVKDHSSFPMSFSMTAKKL